MKLALKVAVSGGLLALLLVLLPWTELKETAGRLSPALWLAAVLGFLAGHVAGAMKWRLLVNASSRRLGWIAALRCHAAGLFGNLCFPGIVGGDVVRAGLAARATGRSESVVVGGLVDRAIDVATLGILVILGGLATRGAATGWGASAAGVLGVAAGIVAIVLIPAAIRRPLSRWPPPLRRRIGRTAVALRALWRNPGILLGSLGLSLALQSWLILLNFWLGRSLGLDAPLAVWFFAWPLAKAVALLPVSLGGIAVRDAAFAAFMAPFGVPVAEAFVASLVWQTVLIAGGLAAGVFWWLGGRIRAGGEPASVGVLRPGALEPRG